MIEELEKMIKIESILICTIDKAINNLSELHKDIIVYRYFEGLKTFTKVIGLKT